MRKIASARLTLYSFILGIGLLIFAAATSVTVFTLMKPAVDFYDLSPEDITKNLHVRADVDFVMDAVVSSVTEHKTAGITTSTTEDARIFAVPFFAVSDDDYIYFDGVIGMEARNKSDYKKIDSIVDASWAWWGDETGAIPYPTESFEVDGFARKMKADEQKIFVDYLVKCGYSASDAKELLVPYVIVNKNLKREAIAMVVSTVVGLLFIALGVLSIIFGRKRRA